LNPNSQEFIPTTHSQPFHPSLNLEAKEFVPHHSTKEEEEEKSVKDLKNIIEGMLEHDSIE